MDSGAEDEVVVSLGFVAEGLEVKAWISVTKMGGFPGCRGISFKARTSSVTVAVKSSVWRSFGPGKAPRQVSTSGSMLPGPALLLSRRSASSSTTTRVRFRPETVSAPEFWM